jgi:predicted AAA+ superfamily ATPase
VKPEGYLPRIVDGTLDEYLESFGAVCIEGPKWCGKTWTGLHHSESSVFLGDPAGNFQNRKLAEISPDLVLAGNPPRLVDEWQEVPPLWDAVRFKVDQSPQKGQYILTGSSTPNHKGILHSGAGRIATLRMRTMSLYESGDSSGTVSLEDLCRGRLSPSATGEVDLRKLADLIVRGGWPGSLGLTIEQASRVPAEYLEAVVNDDIYRIDGVRRSTAKMRLLLKSLARNESTTASNRTLKNDIRAADEEDIDTETIAAYLDVLDRLFITDNQPPFSSNVRSSVRVKQAAKRHLADPSLACALLRMTPESLVGDLETFGFLFEALCERDLRVYAESFGARLYHYQDYRGNEIDAVIELPDGTWAAFEIKLGANQIDAAAEGLLKIKEAIEGDAHGRPPAVLGVICGMSNAAYRRPDGVFVVPITALRE